MILPLNLNRRRKVTLFLTVLLAGIAALNGARMMQVVGISLLGLALAWAFGSDSRVVHWLFLSLGVLLVCGTVGLGWYVQQSDTNLYAQKVAAFEQRIPELAREYPLHKEGQISWGKDLQRFVRKNPKPGGLRTRRPLPPDATSSSHVTWDEPGGQPVTPSPQTKSSGVTNPDTLPSDFDFGKDQAVSAPELDFSKAQPIPAQNPERENTPSLQFEWDQAKPVTALTMPDGHVRYFENERDAKTCQEDFFAWGKTQKMWNEAWVTGLDLSEVDLLKLPGYPPKAPWEHHDWWVCLCSGIFLFALGLGLILGIRAKPLPT